MRRALSVLLTLVPAVTLAEGGPSADLAPLRIEHRPAVCLVTGQHPRIEARIEAAGDLETARVVFHAAESPHWYAVGMRREEHVWTAALPRPKEGVARVAYFITAKAGDVHARLPETSAFIVDVSTSCQGDGLPPAERGPQTLAVGSGAPRIPEGFDVAGIEAFVEDTAEDAPNSPSAAPVAPLLVVPFKHVRLKTVPPSGDSGEWVHENDRFVALKADSEGEKPTRTIPGRFLHGELESLEGDRLVLSVPGGSRAVVRREDLVRLEGREPVSSGRAVVGALVGIPAGLLTTLLACVTLGDICGDSSAVLWIGGAAGMVVGGVAGGSPDWREISLVPQRNVALTLQPRRRGVALALKLRF